MFGLLKLIKLRKIAKDVAFSDNLNLGVVSGKCIYVFDQNGNLLNKICRNNYMESISYCCGRFGFVNLDGYVYITDQNGKLIKKVYVGGSYDYVITMTKDGFVACRERCAFFDFNGNKIWDLDVEHVDNSPSYYKGYWYVADEYANLLIVKNGSLVNTIRYCKYSLNYTVCESVRNTAVCDKYLAVSTDSHLYLYDLNDPTNPKEIWKVEEFNGARQVAFGPGCEYIVVTDEYNQKLKIFNIEGDLIFEKKYWNDVISVAWKDDRIAVSVGADLLVYSTLPLHCFI